MDKTREEFITMIHVALSDARSGAYQELYRFLLNCFTRADTTGEGRITLDRFDDLIEEAAALPRKYGYAPVTANLYPTVDKKTAARARQFSQIDNGNKGYITLDEWINFSVDHIFTKIDQLPKDYLTGSCNSVTKAEFIDFIRKAVVPSSAENRQLYYFLLYTFQSGDLNKDGSIEAHEFDLMIEKAAAAPRRFGLAPRSEDMFPNAKARLEKRKEYFAKMDKDNSGSISFDEWLNYAMDHIARKVACL